MIDVNYYGAPGDQSGKASRLYPPAPLSLCIPARGSSTKTVYVVEVKD